MPYRNPENIKLWWIILDRSMVLRLVSLHKPEAKVTATTPCGTPYSVLEAGEEEFDWAVGHCLRQLNKAGISLLETKVVCRPTLKTGLIPDLKGPVVAIIYYRHYHEIYIE
ncbi:MAG: hypothetical protein U9Q03_03060 [Patescibacteria group bacterium]|nr:hypothetical protein [Patescibacteria group bacterium]